MGPKSCEICEEAQSKYKCPACLIPYCSLACYKKHKEIPCTKPESSSEEKVSPASAPSDGSAIAPSDEKPCYIDEPIEMLQNSQLQSIASSNEIRDLIKDKKLQKLIYDIDCSADAENELDEAMEEATFRLFAEKRSIRIVESAELNSVYLTEFIS
ncbi:hypothetical protein BUALT_Bualt13G0027600 [Buddleja alternifolia]|uniref:HIT-type domain-containing protein n=1 Tax=Buddleja alternifolia TaxID=168488 RepID=A0AAV6WL17_9LAMI|nr:hypothetical protein BUALT_Bualt13G0027600 [Buddleja alternifolia]